MSLIAYYALMDSVSVYQYSSARQYLLDSLSARQKENPRFSVRTWAKRMGLSSHALLVMLLQGKRALRVQHVTFLARGLPELTSQQRLYFQALIQFEAAQTPEEKNLCSLWLADLHPGKAFRAVEVEQFLAISHWVHMAVLAMTDLQGAALTEERAIEILGKRSNASEVRGAVDRLKNLGLLKVRADGTLEAGADSVSTKDDVANAGARAYHKNVMTLAADALGQTPVERREFQACALAVPAAKVALAKEMIRKFRAQLATAMRSEPGDEVYQFNVQFFPLTESPKAQVVRDERTTQAGEDAVVGMTRHNQKEREEADVIVQ
jgi:uncharacterized protein (TIGR02147 family)